MGGHLGLQFDPTAIALLINMVMIVREHADKSEGRAIGFAYQYGNDSTYVSSVKWRSSGVVETQEIPLQIHIQPQPVKSSINITISTDQHLPNCRISIVNTIGISVTELYKNDLYHLGQCPLLSQ
jgi:hypothetical protein